MVYEFKFPDVGEGITEGKLVHWKISVGDDIKVDSIVAEVETDKAVVEIPSPVSGKVSELLFNEGDTLEVGKVIMKLEDGGEESSKESEAKEEKVESEKREDEQPKEVTETEPTTEKKEIEEPQKVEPKPEEEPKSEIKTDTTNEILAMPNVRMKAKEMNIDLNTVKGSGENGQILMSDLGGGNKIEKPTESVEESNLKVGEIEIPKEDPIVEEKKVKEAIPEHIQENIQEIDVSNVKQIDINASPSVRQLARDMDVNINEVVGTGDGGKITSEDIKNFNGGKSEQPAENKEETKKDSVVEEKKEVKESSIDIGKVSQKVSLPQDMVVPIDGVRKVIAERMVESLKKSAQVTLSDEANVSDLVALRNREKDKFKERGIKLTYLPFFIKAFVDCARDFPYFNAIVDDEKNEIVLKSNYNCGFATDTPKGLLVPVVNDCDKKSIVDLANEITSLSNSAREGNLKPEQMNGGTFTISSVGSLGGQNFTPILNYPQIAIMGIGKIMKKPIVKDNQVVVADVVSLSLTFDHRAVDGADAAKFMKRFIELIEDIELLFMES